MQSYIKCRLLTAAVHWMTSLQASFPDFRQKSSPELLSSQSFASCDLVLSSSWQITTGSIQECESWLSLKLGWGNNRRLLVQLSSVLLFSESDCWKSEGQCEKNCPIRRLSRVVILPRKIPKEPSHCPFAQCCHSRHSPEGTLIPLFPKNIQQLRRLPN